MTAPPLRVAVVSSKGGTGKTTTTAALAAILARDGRSVVVVDLDPQGDAAFALGADPLRLGAAAFLLGELAEPEPVAERLGVLAGGPDLDAPDVQRLDPEALLDRLSVLGADAVVIDSPPGAAHLRRLALVAATAAVIPCSPHPFAVRAAGELLGEIEGRREKGRPVAGRVALLANALDRRRSLDAAFADQLRELYGDRADVLEVRQDAGLALATAGRDLPAFAAARGAQARGLADLEALAAWAAGEGR